MKAGKEILVTNVFHTGNALTKATILVCFQMSVIAMKKMIARAYVSMKTWPNLIISQQQKHFFKLLQQLPPPLPQQLLQQQQVLVQATTIPVMKLFKTNVSTLKPISRILKTQGKTANKRVVNFMNPKILSK